MNLVERIEAPAAPFDYGQMERATADEARAAAGRYRSRSKAYVMDTGRDLIAIKERLDHGLFLKWIEAEMGLTPRTAQNFMQAAAQLGSKSEIVSHLPPTTLYKLAAAPAPVREEIVGRMEASEPLSSRAIADRLWEADQTAKREAASAKLTPEERKREAKKKRDAEARRQRDLEKWRQGQAETAARQAAALKQAAEIIAARLDDESFETVDRLLGEANPWEIRRALRTAYGGTTEQREGRRQVGEAVASV